MKKKVLIFSLVAVVVLALALLFGIPGKKTPIPQKPGGPTAPDKSMSASENMYSDAIKKSPKDPQKYMDFGNFYLNHNKIDEAIAILLKSVEAFPQHGPSLENLGFAYYQKKDYDNALLYLNRAVKIIPETATLHNTLGAVYMAKKMYPESVAAYRKSISLESKYYSAYYNLALVLQEMKSPEAAKAWETYIEKASAEPSEASFVDIARKTLKEEKGKGD